MATLPTITVNVDTLIGVNKYNVDEENRHIELADDDYAKLDDVEDGRRRIEARLDELCCLGAIRGR